MEIFVNVEGFDNYQVSNYGKIKNKKTGRLLKQSYTEKKYLKVNLSRDGVSHTRRVHRVVCEHFNPNPGRLPEVDHTDCDKDNNRADNLRWCTSQENKDFYNEKYRIYKIHEPKKYGNIEDMIKATGKPVCVNGVEYVSAGSAAQYICDNEPSKNKATVSKTIRTMLSGKRNFGTMYSKYEITEAR